MLTRLWTVCLVLGVAGATRLEAADMVARDVAMVSGTTSDVLVDGALSNESTFGLTVFVELSPRAGAVGTLTFTPAPSADVQQIDDPWPGDGTFTGYDTDLTGSLSLNGCVDDNGTFVPGALSYSGTIASFPIVASADAVGEWDVLLTTSSGDSSWEGLVTTLTGAVVTVVAPECTIDADCDDGVFCNGAEVCSGSLCVAGGDPCTGLLCDEASDACVECLGDVDCGDGVFCNGAESCAAGSCVAGGDPCVGQFCDEVGDVCVDCLTSVDCDDGLFCNGGETCSAGLCVAGGDPCTGQLCDEASDVCVDCFGSIDCDDGAFCNGIETCVAGACVAGIDPCGGQLCDEPTDACADCFVDGDCDDGLFCNGGETCVGGVCQVGSDPCVGQLCDDAGDVCVECLVDADCSDGLFCTGAETCVGGVCVAGSAPCVGLTCDEASDVCTGCALDSECDDGSYCTGIETCVATICVPGSDPCVGQLCDDTNDVCVDCLTDADCDDGVFCNGAEACSAGACLAGGFPCGTQLCDEAGDLCVDCLGDPDCDDGVFCNGAEACVGGACSAGGNPCPAQVCDESADLCLDCLVDADCDDGTFCNGNETCVSNVCQLGIYPCGFQDCDEVGDSCVPVPASLAVVESEMDPGTTGLVVVSGEIAGDATYGVNLFLEIRSRSGNTGTLSFTGAPPTDIIQLDDPWPGFGTFSPFDTDATTSTALNGSVDDNGTFTPAPLTFQGDLAGFPVVASADAGGVWDLVLSTAAGDSSWEGVPTALAAGTLTVTSAVSLTVENLAIPPGGTNQVIVSGDVRSQPTFGVSILVELMPRAGAVGTLAFTPAPPTDILQLGDPWPGAGSFSTFDTDGTGSGALNGSVDDNGSFILANLDFAGRLSSFPVVASADAAGVWDVTLSTAVGTSSWEGLTTTLLDGTVTVVVGACIVDGDCDDGNSCTQDICTAGICGHTVLTGACDDGDLCTENDTCVADVCVGTSVDCSSLGDFCNVGACNATSGLCEALPANEGGLCDDGDQCTQIDRCAAGVCAGTAVDCTSFDTDCTTGVCNATSGLCDALPINEGQACDDGDLCTINGVCGGGSCVSDPVDCTAFDAECNVGVCNSTTGACEAASADEGLACVGDPCTVGDTCQGGICTGGAAVDCSLAGSECGTASCDPAGADGNCDTLSVVPNGTPCNDGQFCTVSDSCSSGLCVGAGDPCTSGLCDEVNDACVECFLESDCDDGNPCTNDTCVANVCFHANNTAACDDGNPCTTADVCSLGTCRPGSPVDCTGVGDQCGSAQCDVNGAPGNCSLRLPFPNGTACNDGIVCTGPDSCQAGVCQGVPKDCSALDDACNAGTCNSLTGACFAQTINEGGACNDGLTCTTGDVCQSGTCAGTLTDPPTVHLVWSPLGQTVQVGQTVLIDLVAISGTCADQPVASIDAVLVWDPTVLRLVGRRRPNPSPWLTSGFPNDSGLDGLNAPFTGTPANDGDAFWQGIADFQRGAAVPPEGLVATTFEFVALIGSAGTDVELIVSGGAFSRTRVLGAGFSAGLNITGAFGATTIAVDECFVNSDCDDNNGCTTDTCNGGVCQFTNNTLACDDGLFCTASDVCSGGVCIGSGVPCAGGLLCSESLNACVECLSAANCDDGNPCTNDVCNVIGSCENPVNTLPCNDGSYCTATDVCSGGVCVGSGNACPGSVCDEANDQCVECLLAGDCDDGNLCTDDACVGNLCVHTNNTLPCNDGLFCTLTDACSGGACVGSNTPCTDPTLPNCDEGFNACVACVIDEHCDDGNPCTTDDCFFGICSNLDNTRPCDDGEFCTSGDVCTGGVCVGATPTCPELCDGAGLRCVECFVDTDCAGDGVTCTVDRCIDGTCVYEPDDAACDDGLFCNGAEFCHQTLDCITPGNPCDDPLLCDESNDSCGCQAPDVVAVGPRYIAITPRPGTTPVAIRVLGVDLEVACVDGYVQTNGTIGASPIVRTPGVGGWGTVYLRGSNVRPGVRYVAQTECDTGAGPGVSELVETLTWPWADTDNSGDLVDVVDITLVVDGFEGFFPVGGSIHNVDLWGTDALPCRPNLRIDIFDITAAVEAFGQRPFPCPASCP